MNLPHYLPNLFNLHQKSGIVFSIIVKLFSIMGNEMPNNWLYEFHFFVFEYLYLFLIFLYISNFICY